VWRQAIALAEAVLEIEERENRASAPADMATKESS
jgi:hypothetical protein